MLGHKTLAADISWPQFDPAVASEEEMTIVVQINGKLRSRMTVAVDEDPEKIKADALADEKIISLLSGANVLKVIYVPRNWSTLLLNINEVSFMRKQNRRLFIVRLKFQKRSALKFVSRTIPLQAEGMIPRLSGRNFGQEFTLRFIPVMKIGIICFFFAILFGCGYSFVPRGENIDKRIQKIYVEAFDNKTAQAGIENYVRTAFINQFIQNSRLKIVESAESADAIVKGKILNLNTSPLLMTAILWWRKSGRQLF